MHGFRSDHRPAEPALHRSVFNASPARLYHLGIQGAVSCSTLADANETRDWRIYADFGQELIRITRPEYAASRFAFGTGSGRLHSRFHDVDPCLSLFPWVDFRKAKAASKLHTLLDLKSSILNFIRVTAGRVHDIQLLDQIPVKPGAIYVLDRSYFDAERLFRLHHRAASFVIQARKNLRFQRLHSEATDRLAGVFCDQ